MIPATACQFVLYTSIAVAFTWPLLPQFLTAVPADPGDPLLNTWILWWNAQHPPLTQLAWNAPAFYPAHGVLAFSETLLGISLVTNPLLWFGASPHLVYNVAFLASFVLSATFMAMLTYELTGRRDAAFLAGLAFGFHPFRVAHFPQLQVLSGYFMPLGLLGLHRYLRSGDTRWLVCFALSWAMNGLINGYYLLFFSVLVGMWLAWFALSPTVQVDRRSRLLAVAGTWFVALLLIAPVLLEYRAIHQSYGFTRSVREIRYFSADISAFLCTTGRVKLWGFLQRCLRPENELFPGVTLPLLVLVGLFIPQLKAARESIGTAHAGGRFARLQRWLTPQAFYLVATVAMWVLSLGPRPSLLGISTRLPGPYAALMLLPGFQALRVPARLATLMMLCLAVAGAFAFAKLAPRLGRAALPVCALLCAGILADVWIGDMPLTTPPEPIALEATREQRALPILELPMGNVDLSAQYRSLYHGRPVINGYSGYAPPYYNRLQDTFRAHDPAGLAALASFGPIEIVLHKAVDADGSTQRFLDASPQLEKLAVTATHTLYLLPASASAAAASRESAKLRIAGLSASHVHELLPLLLDGELETHWHTGGERGSEQWLEIDLGSTQHVGSVVLVLGHFGRDLPRGLRVDTRPDATSAWSEVWSGNPKGEALAASMRDRARMPVTLAWPGPGEARFVRLRNQGSEFWSIAELEVHGLAHSFE